MGREFQIRSMWKGGVGEEEGLEGCDEVVCEHRKTRVDDVAGHKCRKARETYQSDL